ncbi:MAG: basic amino acid ABC transporter substrate-binding protein [Lysinibacillus sp.]
MKKRLFMLMMVIAAFSLVLAGCGKKDEGAPSSNADGEEGKKVYKVSTEATFAPFESINDSGEIVGLDVDIIQAIADEMDFEVKWENLGWDPLFHAVKNGESDIGAAGISISKKRKKAYDFTDPYYESQLVIVVKENSKIKSLKELKDKKISVQINTSGHIAATKLQGEASANIFALDTQPLAIQEMLNGNTDAVIGDNAVVYEYMKANPKAKIKVIKDKAFEKEYYGFMVKKGNEELLSLLNEGLQKIKDNGKYKEITGTEFK